jgi:hypothetical protein
MIASIFFISSFPLAAGMSGAPSSHPRFAGPVPVGRRQTSMKRQTFADFGVGEEQ